MADITRMMADEYRQAQELDAIQRARRLRGAQIAALDPSYFQPNIADTGLLYPMDQREADIVRGAQLAEDPNYARRLFANAAIDYGVPLSLTGTALDLAELTPYGSFASAFDAAASVPQTAEYLREGEYGSAALSGLGGVLSLADVVGTSLPVTVPAARTLSGVDTGRLAADAMGLGRGILAGDLGQIGEVFQPSGVARGLSADVPGLSPSNFQDYLSKVNPSGTRIAASDRPNLMMGDMYGMLPRGARRLSQRDGVTFYRGPGGDYYATAFNPDVGEQDVVGYIMPRGDMTELAVVGEMQGQGIGSELQYLLRRENPDAPTGGLTEGGEAALRKTYDRLVNEGILSANRDATAGVLGLSADVPNQGFTAYQGSPHDFAAERLVRYPDGRTEYVVGAPDVLPDVPAGAEVLRDFPMGRMRMDKIGTGEGAQAYGHGLYVAEAEPVARGYRDQLSRPYLETADGQNVAVKYGDDVANVFEMAGGEPDDMWATVARLRRIVKENLDDIGVSDVSELKSEFYGDIPSTIIDFSNRADRLESLLNSGDVKLVNQGKMYEVNINAKPEDFLDWDRPLSEQSQAVQDFANARWQQIYGRNPDPSIEGEYILKMASPQHGIDDIKWLDTSPAADQAARLQEAGIPGIRYLDAGSRGAGDGSRNYVVFDENIINIVRKYGIAAAAIMLGMSQTDLAQAMERQRQPSLLGGR